jgi:photosystem II stability/assembly factor-like uncharacterized protein
MKNIICILSIILLSHVGRAQQSNQQDTTRPVQLGQQGWQRVPTGTTDPIVSVSFPTKDTAFAGGATPLRSVDGGLTWQPFFPPVKGHIDFVNGQDGYTQGYSTGRAYFTHNGGASWDSANDQLQVALYVTAVSRDTVYIAGSNDVSHTYDGGKTWSRSTIAGPGINGIAFRDGLHGVVVGSVQPGPQPHHELTAACFTTDDGGKTWVQHYTGATQELVSCTYLDTKSLLAIGALGIAFRSTDQGLSWSRVDSGATHEYYEIALRNQTAIAVGVNGLIRATLDGGTTWYNQASGVSVTLTSVQMFDDKIALASGDSGVILKTNDGGKDWVQIAPQSSQALNVLSYQNPETPNVEIVYTLPQLQNVTAKVYNLMGKEVANLANGELQQSGKQRLVFNGSAVASGTYLYTITTNRFHASGKFEVTH